MIRPKIALEDTKILQLSLGKEKGLVNSEGFPLLDYLPL